MHVHQVIGTPIMGYKVIVQVPSEWSGLSESSPGMEDLIVEWAVPIRLKANTD